MGEGLTGYCDNGALAIDNNVAERTLRLCDVGRRNWKLLGSDNGARTAAILFISTAGCKADQVDPWAYLRNVLARMPSMSDDADLTPSLPDHWFAEHSEAHRTCSGYTCAS